MDKKVIWLKGARFDLKSIYDFIAEDSDRYASVVVIDLLNAGNSLRRYSNRGRSVIPSKIFEIRELIVREYRLIYRIYSDRVNIIAVVHYRRNRN